jgi:outer membrane receptor protein involved in Fe transport
VDDTAFGIPNIQLVPPAGLLDVERVEVIRGPSGTLYGQGSMGGTIKIVTKEPDSESFSGEAFAESSFTEGGGGNYDVGGVFNIPLVEDKLAVRVSGEYDNLSGFANAVSGASPISGENLNLKDANGVRSSNLRVSVLWTPTNTLSVSGFYWYIQDDQDFSNFLATTNPPTVSSAGGVRGLTDVDMNIFSGTVNWKSPIGDVMNNASYFDHHVDLVLPLGTSYNPITNPLGPLLVDDKFKTHQFTDEARLTSNEGDRVNWLDLRTRYAMGIV